MANTSSKFWHSNSQKVKRTKKKLSISRKKRSRKWWDEKNKKPPTKKPKLININERLCEKKNLCLLVISGKAKKSTGSRRTKRC